MGILALFGGMVLFLVGMLVNNDMNKGQEFATMIMILAGLFMIGYGIDAEREKGMRKASKQCQFQECPYEFKVETRHDTTVIER